MSISELDKALGESVASFQKEIELILNDCEYSREPLNKGDAVQIAKSVFYSLSAFQENIVSYLSSKK
jgi:hypothetical protein